MADVISTIHLCDVLIKPTHQRDFATEQEQINYFTSKEKYVFNDCSYQPRTATIKVNGYVDDLRNCNYGFYTNTYMNAWKNYYFWIVAKNYVAKGVTELTIHIDVFQTWYFDWKFSQCFIERETVDNDGFGMHTIPEDLEIGDYVCLYKTAITSLTGRACFILATSDSGAGGGLSGGLYTGLTYTLYLGDADGVSKLSSKIADYMNAGKGDQIAFIFSFPEKFLTQAWASFTSGTKFQASGCFTLKQSVNWANLNQNFNFMNHAYTPFNKKLYCYPYNFLTLTNPHGGNSVLKLELFSNLSAMTFDIDAVIAPNPIIGCTPENYNGEIFSLNDTLEMQGFGLCSWNNDNYANWMAQNKATIQAQSTNARTTFHAKSDIANNSYQNALNRRDSASTEGYVNTAMSAINQLGNFNFLGAGTTALGGIINNKINYNQATDNADTDLQNTRLMNATDYSNAIRSQLASVQDASVQPNTAKGDTSASGLDLARGTNTFFIKQMGIRAEYAQIIDMYFQMYGYKVNRIGYMNWHSRKNWNYIKTTNCNMLGLIPQEDIEEINALFNNGITIWHSESAMYGYDVENPIV